MSQTSNYPQPYVEYLIEFHGARDYFECHEIMEEYWKEKKDDVHRNIWLGLIQIAVGLYHHRTANLPGAIKMLSAAYRQLVLADCSALAIDREALLNVIRERISLLSSTSTEQSQVYSDFNLPLTDETLIRHCQSLCDQRHLNWCAASDLNNRELIFRHTLRDRSDVIAARQAAYHRKHLMEGSK